MRPQWAHRGSSSGAYIKNAASSIKKIFIMMVKFIVVYIYAEGSESIQTA